MFIFCGLNNVILNISQVDGNYVNLGLEYMYYFLDKSGRLQVVQRKKKYLVLNVFGKNKIFFFFRFELFWKRFEIKCLKMKQDVIV